VTSTVGVCLHTRSPADRWTGAPTRRGVPFPQVACLHTRRHFSPVAHPPLTAPPSTGARAEGWPVRPRGGLPSRSGTGGRSRRSPPLD